MHFSRLQENEKSLVHIQDIVFTLWINAATESSSCLFWLLSRLWQSSEMAPLWPITSWLKHRHSDQTFSPGKLVIFFIWIYWLCACTKCLNICFSWTFNFFCMSPCRTNWSNSSMNCLLPTSFLVPPWIISYCSKSKNGQYFLPPSFFLVTAAKGRLFLILIISSLLGKPVSTQCFGLEQHLLVAIPWQLPASRSETKMLVFSVFIFYWILKWGKWNWVFKTNLISISAYFFEISDCFFNYARALHIYFVEETCKTDSFLSVYTRKFICLLWTQRIYLLFLVF